MTGCPANRDPDGGAAPNNLQPDFALRDQPEQSTGYALSSASTTLAFDLQGLDQSDGAAIQTGISDSIYLRGAWDPIIATADATVNVEATAAIINGQLAGEACLEVRSHLSAYLPNKCAVVNFQIDDVFTLSMWGTGFSNATLTNGGDSETAIEHASSAEALPTPTNSDFDVGDFAAAVLGTTQWNIGFVHSPGESLHVEGHELRTVVAEAEGLDGAGVGWVGGLAVDQCDFAFDDTSGQGTIAFGNPQDAGPNFMLTLGGQG